MTNKRSAWLQGPSKSWWTPFRSVPLSHLAVLMTAVCLLFSIIGPIVDLVSTQGSMPYSAVLTIMFFSGLNAALWILVLSRGSRLILCILAVAQAFVSTININIGNWMTRTFHPSAAPQASGVHFASFAIVIAVFLSYSLFILYIRMEGLESLRMRNELKLAHGIQETLVPPVTLRSARFDVYGISYPSDEVGGDLVDALNLPNGDAVAYLADIAGHGLQAGILMGMLKTATRTALLDAGEREPHRTLPILLDRLNKVLPEVKEPQMYATFAGLRLGEDGRVFYALAASPPILHWHALEQRVSHVDESQFPLGLLPVPKFEGETLHASPDDLLIVASDGILEVVNKPGEEYGIERLEELIAANANDALPELATRILASARGFGPRFDDQTILIVRCL